MASKSEISILIIDDEKIIRDMLKRYLTETGYCAHTEQDAEKGLDFLEKNSVNLVIVDLMMPNMDGIEFLRRAKEKEKDSNPEIIVMSGGGTIKTAVEAIKLGAFDFIEKPFVLQKLGVIVNNALQKSQMKSRINFLEDTLRKDIEFSSLIGKSRSFLSAITLAKQLAASDASLLITGESGTGKEFFANAIHYGGTRATGPFIAINCSAIPENLLESEMFGYEKGAFTHAVSRKAGHFENADVGTIFLDEVSELPFPLQAKILRVVQEKQVTRIGSSKSVDVDFRIIAATNRNLEEDVAAGRFREDLFYRLNVIELNIPPLRERTSDIPLFIEHFLKKYNADGFLIDKDVLNVFSEYSWPGNIRELENAILRAVTIAGDKRISVDLLPEKILRGAKENLSFPRCGGDFKEAQKNLMDAFEKEFVIRTLKENNGNIQKSAEKMGITRQTLHKMMKNHGIKSRNAEADV